MTSKSFYTKKLRLNAVTLCFKMVSNCELLFTVLYC